jgi:hypothetical protein
MVVMINAQRRIRLTAFPGRSDQIGRGHAERRCQFVQIANDGIRATTKRSAALLVAGGVCTFLLAFGSTLFVMDHFGYGRGNDAVSCRGKESVPLPKPYTFTIPFFREGARSGGSGRFAREPHSITLYPV